MANPFQGTKERREQEVHQLLDKLQPDTIVLDPDSIARVRQEPKDVQHERQMAEKDANRVRQKCVTRQRAWGPKLSKRG